MEIPKVLYHGTTKPYHDEAIRQFGCYKPHGFTKENPIWLADFQSEAISKAISNGMNSAEEYSGTPLVLIVISSSAPGIEHGWGHNWKAKFLPKDSYKAVELQLENGKLARIPSELDDLLGEGERRTIEARSMR